MSNGHTSNLPPHVARKICDLPTLVARREELAREGKRLVQCHGCFDIVHPGHIRHLRQARGLGESLLVSITADALISKGTGRPLIPQELRAENLAALDCVDLVHIDTSATARDLLERVKPDVYVKGKEYETNNDPRFAAERATVERAGGRVVFSSGDVVFSSTALIAAMEQSADPYHNRLTELLCNPELSSENLNTLINSFKGRPLVVVGETILDTYILCDRPHVASESPVLTLRPLEARHYDGGAAIVARHAASLGAKPILVTALPRSTDAAAFIARMNAEGIEVRFVEVPQPIPEKQRFLVGGQKVMKLDLVQRFVLDEQQQNELAHLARDAALTFTDNIAADAPAAIITDFGLGLFSPRCLMRVCNTLRPLVGTLAGDVSGGKNTLRSMRNMDLICPSESELREAMLQPDDGLPAVVSRFFQETGTAGALVTMGADGLVAFSPLDEPATGPTSSELVDLPPSIAAAERAAATKAQANTNDSLARAGEHFRRTLKGEHVPALVPIALDPLGCGDALLTAATLTLASGGTLLQSAFIGNAAAAVQVQRLGNIPIAAHELRQMVGRVQSPRLVYAGASQDSLSQHDHPIPLRSVR